MLSHNIIVCRLTNHQKPGAYQPSIIGWSPVEGCFFFYHGHPSWQNNFVPATVPVIVYHELEEVLIACTQWQLGQGTSWVDIKMKLAEIHP
jgi:hypothetical protein